MIQIFLTINPAVGYKTVKDEGYHLRLFLAHDAYQHQLIRSFAALSIVFKQ